MRRRSDLLCLVVDGLVVSEVDRYPDCSRDRLLDALRTKKQHGSKITTGIDEVGLDVSHLQRTGRPRRAG